jgi:xanthine dehydrogenase accessory factor
VDEEANEAARSADFNHVRQCVERERPLIAECDGKEVFYEPVGPRPTLLIAGGGHVGQATARLGAWLGFEVVVIDDRPTFTRPELYPEGVKTICGDIPGEIAAFPVNSGTYLVIVTRGHRHDGVVLKECIHSPAAYIGMIGSRRKAHIIRRGLLDEGLAEEDDFRRVYTPIGLDIGAQSVEEIAVSIVSQIVAVRRKRAGATKSLAVFVTP